MGRTGERGMTVADTLRSFIRGRTPPAQLAEIRERIG
jgi:hypothetical protein